MQYKFIEQVPEKQIERATAFMVAVTRLTSSRTATRIAQYISNECLLTGQCSLPHKEFERRTGSCRRTVQRAIQSLIKAQLIARIATTDRGQAVYQCLWERGDEHLAWGKEFDREWYIAKKACRLKYFSAPVYPYPDGRPHAEA